MTAKVCSRCKRTKCVTEFGDAKARKDGLEYHCRECEAVRWWIKRKGLSRRTCVVCNRRRINGDVDCTEHLALWCWFNEPFPDDGIGVMASTSLP